MKLVELEKAINKRNEIERKEEKKERDKERAEKEKEKTHRIKEKSYYEEKLELSKKIFAWKDEFLSTNAGKKLTKGGSCFTIFYSGDNAIDGYSGRFYASKSGFRLQWGWMNGLGVDANKPSELARFNYKFLTNLWKHIESEKVYDFIKKKIEEE